MKHLKSFEKLGYLNSKSVDFSKIYTFDYKGKIVLIGIISPTSRTTGCIMDGYDENNEENFELIKYDTWQWIREATPEEIEKYEMSSSANKYNL